MNHSVNVISLDQSVKLPCYHRNKDVKIIKLKEVIRRAQSIQSLHKSQSQPRINRFNLFASKKIMADLPLSFRKKPPPSNRTKQTAPQEETNRSSALLEPKGFKRSEEKDAASRDVKLFYPIIKSPYQLIEDLKGAVVHISQYKSNGPLIHEMRSDYLIDKLAKEERRKKERIVKSKQALRPLDEEEEAYDAFVIEDPVEAELKRNIKTFLGAKDNKLNQIAMAKEAFFASKENFANFNWDVYVVPHLKNNLMSYPVTKDNQIEYFNRKNVITPEILRYLYHRRLKLQRDADEMKAALAKQQEEVNEEQNALSKGPPTVITSLELKQSEKEAMQESSPISQYELEDFFINKYIRYETTQIASEANKSFILNKFHDMSFQKYYQRHLPRIISHLK